MSWPLALLTTVVLLAGSIGLSYAVAIDVMLIMIPVTAVWAAVDSIRIGLKKYESGIAYGPIILFFGIALLWIIGFPWYLIVRGRIKRSVQPLKEDASAPSVAPAP